MSETICLGDGLGMLVTDVGDRFTWSMSSPFIEAIDCVSKREMVLKIFYGPGIKPNLCINDTIIENRPMVKCRRS